VTDGLISDEPVIHNMLKAPYLTENNTRIIQAACPVSCTPNANDEL